MILRIIIEGVVMLVFSGMLLTACKVGLERQREYNLNVAISHCEQGYEGACDAINMPYEVAHVQ